MGYYYVIHHSSSYQWHVQLELFFKIVLIFSHTCRITRVLTVYFALSFNNASLFQIAVVLIFAVYLKSNQFYPNIV